MKYPYGLVADLHFHPWSSFATTDENGVNSRLMGLLSELRRCAQEVYQAGGNVVVLAGDVFHVRGSVSPTVLNLVRDTLAQCVFEFKVEFVILAGNHDLEGRDSERLGSAITALEMRGVAVVNETYTCWNLTLVPWYDSIEGLKAEIADSRGRIPDHDTRDLILHAPIDGVIEGLPPHGLTPEWLASLGYRRVFAGHYHNHKEFPGGVYSIGALAHHTWSDVGTKAGFLLVYPHQVVWRKSHMPAFVDVDKLVDKDPAELPFLIDGNYVRVKTESATTAEVTALREELFSMGARGVLIQAVPKPPERDDGVATVASAGATLEASVGEFVKSFADPGEVLKAALSVLSAADEVEA